MPVTPSTFRAPPFLRNGHLQTILPVLLPRHVRTFFTRERLELSDGDFLDLDWLRRGASRLAILTHGLEGSSTQTYIRGMAATLARAGWDVLAYNFRGCSGEPNRLPRAYHSGETGDLRSVIARATADYSTLALVGFSLGGNVILKYLGESPSDRAIRTAVAICAPIDLAACARKLDQRWTNRIYLRRFIVSLVQKIEAKGELFPGIVDATAARRMRTFQEFDDRYTGPLHGFRDADDYWTQSSARQFLPNITVPTLLLQPRNDPFLAPEAYPWSEAETNPQLFLETPDSGGHVGFLDLRHGLQPWSERRTAEFLNSHVAT
ncbi:MAG: alpha/beta fold hydrolase [Chthoniobacter sp.]|uniref:YheT family hydrolase n=1 Tax=Chthoniobacter sp. TaxID=2510640 RepID=UPI0032AE54F3